MKRVNMKIESIENTLNIILSDLKELLTLLITEKELLAISDFDNITEIADQKKQIITNIEINDAKFKSILKTKNITNIENSVHDIIIENIPDCAQLWVEIERLLKTCKDKNSINGIILSNNHRQIQESLAILQGQTNEVLIYGSTGESVATKSSLNLPILV